jgi:ABC-type phosphate transport system substrate-binding protein
MLLALVLMSHVPAQGQISVIVAKSSPQRATEAELKEIFAGVKLTWSNGDKIQVVDQPETEAGRKFYQEFVGKSAIEVRSQWIKLVLSGESNAPIKCVDDDATKKAVSTNPNAIGFVLPQALDGSVREIMRIVWSQENLQRSVRHF